MKLFLLLPHLLATLLCADKDILPRMIKSWNLPTKTANGNLLQLEKEEKIYWGKDADASIAPYQILLSYGDSGLCGGAIIDQWWLITAAHCTVLKNEIVNIAMFEVWAGTLHVLEESDSEQHRYVDMIFPHENYNDASLSHDIALLHLKDPLILNENVSVVAIADKGAEPGDTVRASGYGLTETGEVAVRLQYIDQDVPQRTDCLNIYGSLLDDSMWCSGDELMKHRAAQGDSGGPLVLMKDNVTELVGMVSYSITGYDKKPSYDINSDAVKMKSWTNEIMNRGWVELIASTEPQVYSWSNNGLNYQTEFIKMQCNTGKYCRVQVKSLSVNLGSSKYSRIKMFHDYDMTKEPIVELTSETYSSVQAESGFASDSDQAMLVVLLGQEDMVIDLTFTYQVLDDSSCRVPSSQCDEVPDCLDLSDEIGCTYPNRTAGQMSENAVGCYPTDYKCPDVGQGEWCIRRGHVCNGYFDCVGGADEADVECGVRGVVCSLAVVLAAAFMGLCV